MKRLLGILFSLLALSSISAFAGPQAANVQCYWDQDPIAVSLSLPASSDCHVVGGTQFQYDLMCFVPLNLMTGNLFYSAGIQYHYRPQQ